jgi:hypothetical protein
MVPHVPTSLPRFTTAGAALRPHPKRCGHIATDHMSLRAAGSASAPRGAVGWSCLPKIVEACGVERVGRLADDIDLVQA